MTTSRLAELIQKRRRELATASGESFGQKKYQGTVLQYAAKADYVGKVERHAVKGSLDDAFLAHLERDFAKSTLPELNKLTRQALQDAYRDKDEQERPAAHLNSDAWTVAFGYTTWAAPLVYALGRIVPESSSFRLLDRPVRATCFYTKSESGPQPTFGQSALAPRAPSDSAAGSAQLPASAREVVEWITKGRVDIACIPRALVGKALQSVGTIADSAAGAVLVCATGAGIHGKLLPANHADTVSASTREIALAILRVQNEGGKPIAGSNQPRRSGAVSTSRQHRSATSVPRGSPGDAWRPEFLVERGTMAAEFLSEIVGHAQLPVKFHDTPIAELTHDDPERLLDRLMNGDLAGAITWEPIATTLCRAATTKGKSLSAVPMYFTLDPLRGQQHLAMDIVVRADRLHEPKLARVVAALLSETWNAAALIQEQIELSLGSDDIALSISTRKPESDCLLWLGRFFGLMEDRGASSSWDHHALQSVVRALATIRFVVYHQAGGANQSMIASARRND